ARAMMASLTQGASKAMLFVKMKAVALVLAVVGLAISGGLLTHRLLAAQRSPEASTAGAASREEAQAGKPAELKVLDRLDGKWRYEWESKPTEGAPKGSKGRGTSTNEWILGGWFQQRKGKGDDPPHEIVEIWTYDVQTKAYRAWGFIAPGANHYEGAGTWD